MNWQPDAVSGGDNTAAGTDADLTFQTLMDMGGVVYYGSTGWYVDLVFTGLDPSKTYTFATSANRNGSTYLDRITRFTLSGVDAATNSSTPGVTLVDPYTVAFLTGYNTVTGYVARLDRNPPRSRWQLRCQGSSAWSPE